MDFVRELGQEAGVYKFGRNPDVDTTTTPEDVWDLGGEYPFPAAEGAITVISDSVEDGPGNTGALTIRFEGCKDDFTKIQHDVTMNGTTEVDPSLTGLRVWRGYVLTAGSHGTNVGNIDIKIGGVTVARITADFGQTEMAIFTIPVVPGVPTGLEWAAGLARQVSVAAEVAIQTREPDGAWRTRDLMGLGNSTGIQRRAFGRGAPLPVGTDLRIRVLDVTANNTVVHGWFDIAYL